MYLAEIELLLTKKISPKQYNIKSKVYGLHYDEGNRKKIIKKVILTVDLNLNVIHYAIINKVNLIISHHGLFEKPFTKFSPNLIRKLNLLSNYPISIFVLNTPFVGAEGGISDTLMEILYLKLEDVFTIKFNSTQEIPVGRICYPELLNLEEKPIILESILKRIKLNLGMGYVHYTGDLNRVIKKICIVGATFINKEMLVTAKNRGCDCFISFKMDHYLSNFADNIDLTLIAVSHYQTESISLKKLCNILSLKYPKCEFILFESNDPQKIYS